MAELNLWFPVSIYTHKDVLSSHEHKSLVDHVDRIKQEIPSGGDNWLGSIYTSCDTYDVRQDMQFEPLLKNIHSHVQSYAEMHNSVYNYECQQAWFNESVENQFQEFHTHASNVISAVYYLRVPEGSGDIVFKDPKHPDMNPLKNITELNDLNFATVNFEPIEKRLIICRSYLPHMVKPGKNKIGRISVACNYA